MMLFWLERIMLRNAVIEYRNDAGADTVSWSNWRMRKQLDLYIGLTVWSLLWVPGTVGVTLLGFGHKLPLSTALIFIPILWFGVGIAALLFLRLFMNETIRVRDDMVILTLKGLGFRHTSEVRREHIKCLSLESGNDEVETLNLIVSRGAIGSS